MSQHLDAYKTTGSSPPTRVILSRIDLAPSCTVATGVGLDAEGNEVTFAADRRPALAIAEALAAGEEVEVLLEDWQVLARRRP